ncbi:hypothetical protein [Actinoallomurus sp. CA-142502]|uniref:hypothetical protein n=1 Tax=Actinoallomurus sp. CA-142502 TaxID=3239885 RepID=UPI003D948127
MADGNITSFDKSHYEQLLTFLKNIDTDVEGNPQYLGPSADLKLDATLNSRFHPGSQEWSVCKDFLQQATSFGTSMHSRLANFDTDLRNFYSALKNAEAIFEKTDDLATYDASKFSQDYPDVTGGGGNPTTT